MNRTTVWRQYRWGIAVSAVVAVAGLSMVRISTATAQPPAPTTAATPPPVATSPHSVQVSPVDPEDIGVVYRLDSNTQWTPLEMHRAQFRNDRRALRGDREMLTIRGTSSPVRFKEGQEMVFVVHVLQPMMLPTTFELFPFDIGRRNNVRDVTLSREGFGEDRGSAGFHLRVQRFGPNSFKLIPSQRLPAGEYAFKYGLGTSASKDLYCFGVDPATGPVP